MVFLVLPVLLVVPGCASSPAPDAGSSTAFPTNSHGENYGSAADARSPEEEPDLIAVTATNGADGYARRDELEDTAHQPNTPEEAVAYQQTHDDAAVRTCLDTVRTEVESIPDDPPISDTSRSAVRDLMNARVTGTLPTNGVTALRSLLAESGVANSDIPNDAAGLAAQCAAAAAESQVRRVPVYQNDGVTIVGEFEVGG